MLKHLLVENYALIEKLDISFDKGLTIITGETGAGKSILLGALALILGQRADTNVLHDKEKKCLVEGVFDIKSLDLEHFFEENELDYDDETTIRREINAQGKSRAFVNDTPVTINILKDLGEKLIDIHSQHQNLLLSGTGFQFNVVDGFAGNQALLSGYRQYFVQWNVFLKQLEALREEELKAKSELDFMQFQFDELNMVKLDPEEYKVLEAELDTLKNAETIQLALKKADFILSGSEPNINRQLIEVLSELSQVSKFNPAFLALKDRLDVVAVELKDIDNDICHLLDSIHADNERQEELSAYFDVLNRLFIKHHVKDIEGLIEVRNDLDLKINKITSLDDKIEQLESEIRDVEQRMSNAGKLLSERRKAKIPDLEKQIEGMLSGLGMPNGQFKVRTEAVDKPTQYGYESLNFMFNANLGGVLGELGKIASGGELSRVMLCIKSILIGQNMLPTIIFDEIDTGISGEVAAKAGMMLSSLARNKQVISITHLPQIASKGQQHFFVYKTEEGDNTYTSMRKLTDQERIMHIAQLISGEKTSQAAIETARILLEAEKSLKN
ncbi:MAG: DNA repair protein RecN [Bacteroidales bacterium]|nr:DNA repair protein RecN [Bacteroidales bacterium]